MKILHVLCQRPGRTGSGVFLQSLLEEADKHDHKQAVIVGIPPKETYQFNPHIQVYPVHFDSEKLPFPVVGMSNVMPYRSTRYCDLTEDMFQCWKTAFSRQLEKAVNEFQPDIILSHHLWILSILAGEMFPNIPLIVISHGTGLRQIKQAKQFSELVTKGCRKIDLVLCPNRKQKKLIEEVYGYPADRIIIIGSGYNADLFYFKKKQASKSISIVYAGKLSPAKGIHAFLQSIQEIKNPHIEFVIIGSANKQDTAYVYEQAADTHHPIIFTGSIPQSELAGYFRNSDIFVLPSFYEGMPLVLIEALACHLRIVVSDLPGMRDFLGTELCESGMISFVPLPRLENGDVPFKDDLPKFEKNLRLALETQISNVLSNYQIPVDLINERIGGMTWDNLFGKIQTQMNRLLNESHN